MAADDRIANAIIEYWYTRLRLHVALLFVLCAAPRVSCTRVSPAAQVFSNDTAFKGTNSDCEGYIFAAEFLQRRVGDGVCDFSNSHSLAELLQLDPSLLLKLEFWAIVLTLQIDAEKSLSRTSSMIRSGKFIELSNQIN